MRKCVLWIRELAIAWKHKNQRLTDKVSEWMKEWVRVRMCDFITSFSRKWFCEIIHCHNGTWFSTRIHTDLGVSVRDCDHVMPASFIDITTSLKLWPIPVWFVIVCIGLTTHKHTHTPFELYSCATHCILSSFIQINESLPIDFTKPNIFTAKLLFHLHPFLAHLFRIYSSICILSIFDI